MVKHFFIYFLVQILNQLVQLGMDISQVLMYCGLTPCIMVMKGGKEIQAI